MPFVLAAMLALFLSLPLNAQPRAPYRIGFIVPLSGPLADFGAAIEHGVTLAAEEHGHVARAFKPFYEDSRYESTTALRAFQKLHSVDRVHALYVFGGPMSDTLAPVAERAGMPMFSTEYDTRYTRSRWYVVRFANNASDYAQALVGELRARGMSRFVLIKVENQYHNTLAAAFLDELRDRERAELLANFQPSERDFRSVLAKIALRPCDALGIYLTPGMQHAFLGQLKTLPRRPQLFGSDTFESPQESAGVEKVSEGALFANSAVSEDFARRFERRFHSRAQLVHAALAYEFSVLTADLFKNDAHPIPPAVFVERFALPHGRDGVCGRYYYRNTPETGQYFSFPIAVREVRQGRARVISLRPAP